MEFKTVCSSEEALETLTQEGGMAKVLAGGSDLMLQLKRKELEAGILVHIQRASDLKGISLHLNQYLHKATTQKTFHYYM